jgi:hypothetical protein
MSDREEFEPTADQKRASELVRALPRAEADTGFRDRLRADFAAGRLGESPDAAPRPARRGRGWIRALIPAAFAGVLAVLVLFNAGPPLELSDVSGEGTVFVDGRVFPASDFAGIAGAIYPGASVTLSEGVEIDFVYPETAAYQLSSATATIPEAPGRWYGRSVASRVDMGELRILTGPEFSGMQLTVTTPEGQIEVTGTLVSVFRDSTVTCVCVHEGTAAVGITTDDMENIPPGKRKVMFADGSPPKVTDIAPPHMDHLVKFEARYRTGIRPLR